jgi:hypothetical protein
MYVLAEYKFQIFAGVVHTKKWNLFADESGGDIAVRLIKARKGRRKLAQQKYNQTEAGRTAKMASNKIWQQSKTGRAAKRREQRNPT